MNRSSTAGVELLLVAFLGGTSGTVIEAAEPTHLQDVRALVKNLRLEDTSYKHGEGLVRWQSGSQRCVAHTDCSGFINHLLRHSYRYDKEALKRWFGKSRPTADVYHDKIAAGSGFTSIKLVKDIQPGDILAVKYLPRNENTGHIMLASGVAKKITPSKSEVSGLEQWELPVFDVSRSGHGPLDTRSRKGKDGKDHPGLGEGVLRLYTDKQGKVAGHSWSTRKGSTFRAPNDRHLVIGRLTPGYKP